ncbi:MAG: PEP-utilizing enzyme [Firmicutes bacterium]|nr:PEP-utilizing enzyme [Bacillota bacterium]
MKIFNLGEIESDYLSKVGGKARGLDGLIRAGFNVPKGFVLVDANLETDLDKVKEYYLNSGLIKVAVRSSASVEDGVDFSYAGQFATFLDVEGGYELQKALKKCIESLNAVTAKSYGEKFDRNKNCTMSVVVQEMIDADCAGVCFTTDPNNSQNILIEAVDGGGEALVSGSAAAIQYSIEKSEINSLAEVLPPLTTELIKNMCILAIELQDVSKMPLDLEWCVKNDKIYWLQSRPITVTEVCEIDEFNPKEDLTSHAITRYNISEMLPGAVTPLSLHTTVYSIDWGIRKMLQVAGGNKKMKELPPFGCVFSVKGHLFLNLSSLYRITRTTYLAKVSSVDLSICDRILEDDEKGIVPGKNAWFLPRLINSIKYIKFIMSAQKAKKRIAELSENFIISEGEETIQSLYDKIIKAQEISNQVSYLHYITSGQSGAMSSATTGALDKKFKCREKSRAVLAEMLERIDDIESVDILASLCRISSAILKNEPRAKEFSVEQLTDYMKNAGDEVRELHNSFMRRHGHRAIREAELRSQSWANDEKAFMQYLKTVITGGMTEPKKQSPPDLEQIIKQNGFKGIAAGKIKYFVNQAREGVRNREYSKAKMIKVYDVIKQAYSRLAKMLVEKGRLPEEDAIYFLTPVEIGMIVKSENAGLVKKALQRRRLLKTQSQLQFAEVYTKIPEPIVSRKVESGEILRGTPVSRGIATGPARVVKSTEDALNLQQGEIMVAEFTDIGWSPFYCLIEGLVTEVGSALSHGGVVAREYALPLVANVASATSSIKTGDIITIDGEAGIVQIG